MRRGRWARVRVPMLALITAAGVLAGLGPARAATGWVTTGTAAERLVDAVDFGPEPAATPVHVVVALNLRNESAARALVDEGVVVTPAQFVSQFAPTAVQAQSVASYLAARGFANVTTASNRLLVSATGTVGRASAAFATPIERYSQNGRVVYANTGAARVPSALGGVVGAVLGLNDAAVMRSYAVVSTDPPRSCLVSGVGFPCEYAPQGFWRAYDVAGSPSGVSTNVAIFAEGNLTPVVKDLRTEETATGLPQVPVTVVATGPHTADTSGVDEWDLDTQFSTGMAKTVARLYLYDAPSLADSRLAEAFNTFAAQHVAKAASASFGECEFQASLDGSMLADDHAFLQAAAQGQTVFAASGDTGGFCPVGAAVNGIPAGAPDVSYPASSRFVVGVGGTTLVTNGNGTYDTEAAWFAGGGGPSLFEAQPLYQQGIAPPTGTLCGALQQACGRTVPDVAMDADPNTGANVYVDGQAVGIGGTSLSSPLALGVWARAETGRANAIGFANRVLYPRHGTAVFHDIVAGDTGPYPATPGYDLATGLGTFDVAALIHAIG